MVLESLHQYWISCYDSLFMLTPLFLQLMSQPDPLTSLSGMTLDLGSEGYSEVGVLLVATSPTGLSPLYNPAGGMVVPLNLLSMPLSVSVTIVLCVYCLFVHDEF